MDKVVDYARASAWSTSIQPVLSMSLGAGETTVLRMTTAYSDDRQRRQEGRADLHRPRAGPYGQDHFQHDTRPCDGCADIEWSPDQPEPDVPDTREQVIDPRTAYQMVSILEGVVQRGTGKAV